MRPNSVEKLTCQGRSLPSGGGGREADAPPVIVAKSALFASRPSCALFLMPNHHHQHKVPF